MSLYATYLLVFGICSVIGVPMISFWETTLIHNEPAMKWVESLGSTLGISFGVVVLIAVLGWFFFKPIDAIVKKAESGVITEEERYAFIPAFKKLNFFTAVLLIVGYMMGNGGVILLHGLVIKDLVLGKTAGEAALSMVMVVVFCILYAVIHIFYCTTFYKMLIQNKIRVLKIYDVKEEKITHFTVTVGWIAFFSMMFVAWHMLCAGYGFARYPERLQTTGDLIKKAMPALAFSILAVVPMLDFLLINLRKRFNLTQAKVKNLREEGDLVSRIPVASFDDFGALNSEMNSLMAYLQNLVKNVRDENNAVSDNAMALQAEAEESSAGIRQIVDSFQDISSKNSTRDNLLAGTQSNIIKLDDEANRISALVSGQASSVQENSSSITEMVANINSVSEMVNKAKTVSVKLADVSEKGTTEVSNTLKLIDGIAEKSERMSEITKVIQSVASETNLLAMNAAIEAAHAGEAGAGFSVVADEIRKLAESTSKSTKEIKDLIEDMIDVVEKSTQSMSATSVVFNNINAGVKDQVQVVETIANAMEEQSIGASETLTTTNEISAQIAEINSLVQSQVRHNGEIKDNINQVVELSNVVNDSLAQSNNVVSEFAETLNHINDSSKENRTSVERVAVELSKFKLD